MSLLSTTMNSINKAVILKKLQRIDNVTKHAQRLILDISEGMKEVRPVYKVNNKSTIIDTYDELIKILYQFNINFAVSNTAKRGGRIGILITIKTHVKDGISRAKAPTIKGGIKSRNKRQSYPSKENLS